ncbi:hypothetical protein PAPYR_550 [Paratrimastix pyriformis]|uniref:Uncharacterized protein n=1 Tax=Paratrimastix pyriformis TaxID=342808 RepID=A0ABQ8UVX3_9EUKA|nr:hypothetical protein PAPYR_550 [Paratrimastix pyriformis]
MIPHITTTASHPALHPTPLFKNPQRCSVGMDTPGRTGSASAGASPIGCGTCGVTGHVGLDAPPPTFDLPNRG